MTEREVLCAIRTITDETGYPPDAEELAYALNTSTRRVQSALIAAKRTGRVRYDEAERFVLTEAA